MTGIGMKRDPDAPRHGMKRSRLKPVSAKQRVRNDGLREKREIILSKLHELWGLAGCMADPLGDSCMGRLELDHVQPRGRCPNDVDGFDNLQILCHRHHFNKTFQPKIQAHDYRTPAMRQMLKELNEKG